MTGVVGFILWAGSEGEVGNSELAFGRVGVRRRGGEDAAGGGKEEYVVSARGDF